MTRLSARALRPSRLCCRDELDGLINEAKPGSSKASAAAAPAPVPTPPPTMAAEEPADARGAQALVQMAAAPMDMSMQAADPCAMMQSAASAQVAMMAPQAMMQMPNGAMAMAHPSMMMHAAAAAAAGWGYPAAMMPVDMTAKAADVSAASAYYPMMMPGYTYTAAS